MGLSAGIIEVYGLAAAFAACDAGCKAADVTVENFDRNKPANPEGLSVPLIVAVKFRGTVDNVKAALDCAARAAERVSGVVSSHVMASTEPDTEFMLKISGFDRK